jgi:hypothetical protein
MTQMLKAVPIMDMNEVEMVKTTSFFKRKGFLPLSIKFRTANTSRTQTEIIEEIPVPEDIAKTHGNTPIKIKRITMIDTYGKTFTLVEENRESLENIRDFWINIFPSSEEWDNRVEEFVVKITKRGDFKNWLLKFKRGETAQTPQGVFSLRLEEIKEPGFKWKIEKEYREDTLAQMARGIATDVCVLNYANISSRKPKCH